jgi:hypothetical protein
MLKDFAARARRWTPDLLLIALKSPAEAAVQLTRIRLAWLSIAQEGVNQAFALNRKIVEHELDFLTRVSRLEKGKGAKA